MITKGQKINDRYQIIRMIGEGGMANVYLAVDTILDRKVAVKILRGDLSDDEKFVRRFQREAISASSLSHPNIVEMYDVGEDNGSYFIVMEYVEGKTLKNLIKRRGALTLPEVVDIMKQLLSGIAHAHASYIIHRDIKPQNVLILDDGTVKITDFGIAMALNSNELTQTNSVMGSVHYLPPEQANGNGATIKSDIYSLGILMYELLTGKIPFRGENAVEIAIKQMKEQIPSVCKQNTEIPQSIENIILKACAKNPKNRYDVVSEMYNELDIALSEAEKGQKRVVYRFPEQELEETKVMPNLKEIKSNPKPSKDKKIKLTVYILSGIALFLALLLIGFAIIYPKITEVPEVKVPDVANMSVVDGENKIKKSGLKVKVEIQEKNSSEVEKGKIIGTLPQTNRSVKEGTEITLIVSSGVKGLTLEDYKDKNFYEIKAMLEANGIIVLSEKEEVENPKDYKENVIINQKPASGAKIEEGDTVTLILPDIITEYPDFTDGSWNLKDINAFATEYGITLSVEYLETPLKEDGEIISQSRAAKTRVITGATLKIIVATEPTNDVNGEVIE